MIERKEKSPLKKLASCVRPKTTSSLLGEWQCLCDLLRPPPWWAPPPSNSSDNSCNSSNIILSMGSNHFSYLSILMRPTAAPTCTVSRPTMTATASTSLSSIAPKMPHDATKSAVAPEKVCPNWASWATIRAPDSVSSSYVLAFWPSFSPSASAMV